MDFKSKGAFTKGGAKGVSRQFPPRKEGRRPPSGDTKMSVGRKTNDTRSKPSRTTNGLSEQQKTRVTTTTNWVRGGSSLSFADVVRRKTENVTFDSHVEIPDEDVVEAVPEEHDVVVVTHDVQQEPITVYPVNNENEDIIYSAAQQEAVTVQADILASQEEEDMDEVPPIKYYVLEIDRILEESVLLPPHATAIAAEYVGFCTFSGQVGRPPTAPAAPQLQQFYRPETTAARTFAGMGGASDMSRAHWASQSGHSIDYASTNWSLQERNQRGFHQGLQYNSYAPPVQQQAQRNFIPQTVNRMLQNEMSDVPLRQLRDAGAFNRHPGNGGGVW